MSTMPIVVAEDEEQVRRLIKVFLSRNGLPVVEVEDGLMAISAIQELDGKISALVTDVQMPNLDGVELCREVKEKFPSVPVLLMSGTPVPEVYLTGDAFLQKPFQLDILLKLISTLSIRSVGPTQTPANGPPAAG